MIKHSFLIIGIIFIMFMLTSCYTDTEFTKDDIKEITDEYESEIDELEGEVFSLKEDLEYIKRFVPNVYYKSLEDNYVHKYKCFNIQDDDFIAVNKIDLQQNTEQYEKCPNCFNEDYFTWIDTPCYITSKRIPDSEMYEEINKNNLTAFYSRDFLNNVDDLVYVQPNDTYYHKLICDELVKPNAWTSETASNRGYEKCPICFGN